MIPIHASFSYQWESYGGFDSHSELFVISTGIIRRL